MDALKNWAETFGEQLAEHVQTVDRCHNSIISKLDYLKTDEEKLRFLSYLNDYVESRYQKHIKMCFNPLNCDENKSYETVLYTIKQKYNELLPPNSTFKALEKPAFKFFNEGKYFDGYSEIREKVKEVEQSIILVDNYVDAKTLSFFSNKPASVQLQIKTMTKSLNQQLEEAVELYNQQVGNLTVEVSSEFRDRFLILDHSSFFLINQSIRDAAETNPFLFIEIGDPDIKEVIIKKLKK